MTVQIAICADKNVEVGLHTTLYSAMANIGSGSKMIAHLFLSGFGTDDVQLLRSTLAKFAERCELRIHDVELALPLMGKALHGSRMPYALLAIPSLLDVERILCLDADLLVMTDLSLLFNLDLSGQVVGVVLGSLIVYTSPRERDFLLSVGLPGQSHYFNSGVLLIDVREWKAQGLSQKCLEFVSLYPSHLHTADQTVLNAVLTEKTFALNSRYNILCPPSGPPINANQGDGIYHLVGSPKPWDFLGEVLHSAYPAFRHFLQFTSLSGYRSHRRMSVPRLLRTIKIGRSFLKAAASLARKNRHTS